MRRLLLFMMLLGTLPTAAVADEHARSAFSFADRRDWSNTRAHAKKAGDHILIKLMTWQYLLDSDSGAGFEDITQFIAANPHWPEQNKLRVRAEMTLRDMAVDEDTLVEWFAKYPPLTGVGKIALVKALQQRGSMPQEKLKELVREAWTYGDFEAAQQKDILVQFGGWLTEADHIARADRLLWEEKTAAAKDMLTHLPQGHRYLVEARRMLIKDKRAANPAVAAVPKALKDDPGLMYNRLQYRARRGLNDGVREMLLAAPKTVPYPEKWWRYREAQIRAAIDEGNYALAGKLLANHEQLSGAELADATWLAGWLELEFLRNPKKAYDIFSRMYDSVSYPVSRSRAAFWAGRAAAAAGDSRAAENWYATASAWPTTFYGQLAIYTRYGSVPLRLPTPPEISDDERQRFERTELARAVKLCLAFQAKRLAGTLIAFLIESAETKEQAALAAELGARAGYPHLGVRGAKKAMQKSIVLTDTAYPQPKTPDIPIERALTLAIARQESEFDTQAVSRAGARGLMQLLPSTAKETARKLRMRYSTNDLFKTDYNLRLGSHYLSRLITGYDGSYVLAIAAYNAGPGNVRKWIKQFGTPGHTIDGAINWIEKIPFAETRNYVQRVLENVQVYRHLEAGDPSPNLILAEDLIR